MQRDPPATREVVLTSWDRDMSEAIRLKFELSIAKAAARHLH